ncbi:MAG: HAD hydrolase family protein [Bacteroidetes bacterium]|nr:HAD hydrolase family protein [Bacteroidota bacterium]
MNVLEYFKNITTLVFDIDGVLTDGKLYLMPGGSMVRVMNIKDGYALQLAVKMKYHVLIVSGGDSPESEYRLRKLGIREIYMKVEDKLAVLHDFMHKNGLKQNEVLCMGDDIPDYSILKSAGIACCPADAAKEIKNIAHYISKINGGEGCVRDVIEKVLQLNNSWPLNTQIQSR